MAMPSSKYWRLNVTFEKNEQPQELKDLAHEIIQILIKAGSCLMLSDATIDDMAAVIAKRDMLKGDDIT